MSQDHKLDHESDWRGSKERLINSIGMEGSNRQRNRRHSRHSGNLRRGDVFAGLDARAVPVEWGRHKMNWWILLGCMTISFTTTAAIYGFIRVLIAGE